MIKKIQMRPKGNGTYSDILYPETSAAQVFANDGESIEQKLPTLLTTAQKGSSNGLAPLDVSSKIPSVYMPSDTNLELRTSDPASPATGRIWLRTDL